MYCRVRIQQLLSLSLSLSAVPSSAHALNPPFVDTRRWDDPAFSCFVRHACSGFKEAKAGVGEEQPTWCANFTADVEHGSTAILEEDA